MFVGVRGKHEVRRKSVMRRTGVIAISAVSLALLYALPANAVHDEGIFQLDGNASTADNSTPSAAEDWDLICKANLTTLTPPGECSFQSGYTPPSGTTKASPSTFVTDAFAGDVDDIFTTGGSKDDLDIPNWKFKNAKPSPDKDDLEHGYAAEYVCTTANNCSDNNNDKFLYFGADRFDNEGDANIAFWFLQSQVLEDGTAADPTICTTGGGCNFSGSHVAHTGGLDGKTCYPGQTGTFAAQGPSGDPAVCPANGADDTRGDILVVSAFTNGGAEPGITLYEWVGKGNAPLALKQTNDRSVVPIPIPGAVASQGCATPQLLEDAGCAMVNTDPETSPWPFTDKDVGATNEFQPSEFYEGGLNLTSLGLANTCFSSFLVNTRSSQAVNSELHDYMLGQLSRCDSGLTTTPKDGTGAAIPAGGLSIGSGSITVKDSAQLTISGISTWTGTMQFRLCKVDSPGLCTSSTGTEIDAPFNVSNATTQPILSSAATITSAGRYCWWAKFTSTTTGLKNAEDGTATECFVVNPVSPTLTTDATNEPSETAAVFGTAINDVATLTGTATQPGKTGGVTTPINPTTAGLPAAGTITFKLYGPSASASCVDSGTGANLVATSVVNVTGDSSASNVYQASDGTITGNGGTLIPPSPGHYWWRASYSGNLPNTLPAPKDANNAATFTPCGDLHEDSVVQQIPTEIKTKQSWFPNDTATITSSVTGDNLGAGGTVDFFLYNNGTCTAGTNNANLQYSERQSLVGGTHSEEVGTHNYTGSTASKPGGGTVTPFSITTAYTDAADSLSGAYSWKVVYTPAQADVAHTGRQSACTAGSTEKFNITYTNDGGTGSSL